MMSSGEVWAEVLKVIWEEAWGELFKALRGISLSQLLIWSSIEKTSDSEVRLITMSC